MSAASTHILSWDYYEIQIWTPGFLSLLPTSKPLLCFSSSWGRALESAKAGTRLWMPWTRYGAIIETLWIVFWEPSTSAFTYEKTQYTQCYFSRKRGARSHYECFPWSLIMAMAHTWEVSDPSSSKLWLKKKALSIFKYSEDYEPQTAICISYSERKSIWFLWYYVVC